MSTDLAKTYDRIAEDWYKDHQSDDWRIAGTKEFLFRLPKEGHVLDVGCESGIKSHYMLKRRFRVTGIDISSGLLEIARRESPEGDFHQLSMTELDALTQTYDGVFAQASLLHIPRKDASGVVKAMARCANNRGSVYLAVKEAREGKPEEEVAAENDYGYEYERFFSYFTMAELETFMTEAGLQVVWDSRNPSPSGKTVWLQIIGQKC